MSEYIKVSIHNHFGGPSSDCTIDKQAGLEVVHDLARTFKQIDEARGCGFGILGQTSSNDFDAASYLLVRTYGKTRGVELLPGVEVRFENWADPSRAIHLVLLFDPATNVFKLQEDIRAKYVEYGRYSLAIDQARELFCQRRAIVCAHGIRQEWRSAGENPEVVAELVSLNRFTPVAFEDNRSYHKMQLQDRLREWLTERAGRQAVGAFRRRLAMGHRRTGELL